MNKLAKTMIAIMLALVVVFVVGCKKNENNGNEEPHIIDVDEEYEYVDLGLPSGTLWATCNVGAKSPEESGSYFAWGENAPKKYYSWSNYQYGDCVDGFFQLTKYCTDPNWGLHGFVDSLVVLEPMDDAARANRNSDWRIPTGEEWEELYQKTEFEWTTVNGIEGRLLTSWNGNSIFLPATGFYLDEELICPGLGIYWSNTLFKNAPERAWSFHFNFENCHLCGTYERSRGQVIRPVRNQEKRTSTNFF